MKNYHMGSAENKFQEYRAEDYWMAIYSRKGIVLSVVFVAMIFSAILSHVLPPVYEAVTVFYVPSDATESEDITGKDSIKVRMPSGNQDNVRAYSGILKGKDAKKALHEIFSEKSLEDLDRDVDFEVTREGLIKIYVRDRNPVLAAGVANGFVDYYNEFARRQIEYQTTKATDKIDNELLDINKRLNALKLDKQSFLEKNKLASLKIELEELERNRARLEIDLLSKMSDLKAEHPEIVGINGAIEKLDARISALPRIIRDYERYEEQIKELDGLKSSLEATRGNLVQGLYHLKETGVVVTTAVPPDYPIFPVKWLNVFVAGVFGLLSGIMYSFLLEYLDTRTILRRLKENDAFSCLEDDAETEADNSPGNA